VIVIAATNRPDLLDSALLRPGRFDRKIYVPPPDDASRLQILEINLKPLPLASDVCVSSLVDASIGFSGAEVASMCSEAAMLAIEEDVDIVSQAHLIAATSAIKPQITTEVLSFYADIEKKFAH
jgi:SpoVK/Ycf46/Vps4 family AAA+-type ATPase